MPRLCCRAAALALTRPPLIQVPGMKEIWSSGAVFKTNALELRATPKEARQVQRVRLEPKVYRVGSSSWAFCTELRNADAPAQLLAVQKAVMVHVDAATSSVPQPLPAAAKAALQAQCAAEPVLASLPDGRQSSADKPAGAHALTLVVRMSDCDALGHVNNAKWALLVAEAYDAAERAGAYEQSELGGGGGGGGASKRPRVGGGGGGAGAGPERQWERLKALSLGYIGQAHAGEALRCSTWRDREQRYRFVFELEGGGGGGSGGLAAGAAAGAAELIALATLVQTPRQEVAAL